MEFLSTVVNFTSSITTILYKLAKPVIKVMDDEYKNLTSQKGGKKKTRKHRKKKRIKSYKNKKLN